MKKLLMGFVIAIALATPFIGVLPDHSVEATTLDVTPVRVQREKPPTRGGPDHRPEPFKPPGPPEGRR